MKNKILRKICSATLAAVILGSGAAAVLPACGTEFSVTANALDVYGDFSYSVNISGGITISRYHGSATEVSIPASINGKTVTAIGSYAFYLQSKVTSITIPSGVTKIGKDAFTGCYHLTSLSIPSSVTSIGESAFTNCIRLKSITLPEGLTSISDSTFAGCPGLTSITLPSGIKSIGNEAFYGCTGLTNVTIPSGVTTIEKAAFYCCTRLTSVTIPANVTTIGEIAFGYYWSYTERKNYKVNGLTFTGKNGSSAEAYANKNGFQFVDPSVKKLKSLSLSTTSYIYDGKAKTPTVTLKDGTKTLKKGTDYTVTYKNNTKPGKATVTIKGKGNYTGTITKTFTIKPKKATLKTATSPKTKQLKATWTKDTTATGYQIQYSTSSKFTSGNKTKLVSKNSTTSATLTGLTKGKTYYVRIRSYKTIDGKKVYGAYSAVKKVKIK